MTILRLAYVQAFKDRHGRMRFYYRRGGTRFPLPGRPGEVEFMTAYADAAAQFATPKQSGSRAAPGTIDAVAEAYLSSSEYKSLTDMTRRTYRSTIDRFRDLHGTSRLSQIQRKHVKAIISKWYDAHGAASANKLLKMIRLLIRYSVELGLRTDDPTLGIKQIRPDGDGFADWSEADIKKFEDHWPSGSKQRLALYLALYTGQRRSDVVRMGRQHVSGDTIAVRQQKTGARLLIPIHPTLKAELDKLSGDHLTFIVTEYGAAFSVSGLGNWFGDAARKAGLADRTMHGLRKSAARRLAEAGATSKQIAAVTGHASLREVERYTAAAAQVQLARDAVTRLR